MRVARVLLVGLACASASACGTYQPARLSEPAVAATVAAAGAGPGRLRVRVERVFLTEDVAAAGLGSDAALAVELELELENGGAQPYTLGAVSATCVMELDRARPGETRALVPAGGGAGAFPNGALADEPALGSVVVPPGQARAAWVLFRGYEFPASDVPRRIVLGVPDAGGRRLEVVLADPARGSLRWQVAPVRTGWALGFQNTSLFADHLNATGVATVFSRVMRVGPLVLDVGLSSRLLVQSHGDLASPTSSFAATGLAAHVAYPFLTWGGWQEPRALALYAGGEALVMLAIQGRRDPDDDTPPQAYGAMIAEAGLQLDVGALRPRATPFPLSAAGPTLPRWSLRVGYTQWWVDGGTSAGYTTSLRLAW